MDVSGTIVPWVGLRDSQRIRPINVPWAAKKRKIRTVVLINVLILNKKLNKYKIK